MFRGMLFRLIRPFGGQGAFTIPGKPAGIWYMHSPTETSLVANTLFKRAVDKVWFVWSGEGLPEIEDDGETITSATVTIPSGVTVTHTTVYNGNVWVGFRAEGGTSGSDYIVTVSATLSGGRSYKRQGTLTIR
jgi:hypothetical protein